MLTKLRHNPVRKAILATILPGVAGAVNATSFLTVGYYTSHMTGNLSRIGDAVTQGRYPLALYAASLVAAFILGAVTATAFAELSKRMQRAQYALPLALEAAALLAVIGATLNQPLTLNPYWVCLICFAMGLQNALVTRISGAVVRTTHITGICTDIGIEMVHIFFWVGGRLQEQGLQQRVSFLSQLHRDPRTDRLRLHAGILLSFLGGAIIGPLLHLRFGERALLLPVVIIVGLGVFDLFLGLDPPTVGAP